MNRQLFTDSSEYKNAVDEYLSGAFDTLVEPQHVRNRSDPTQETVETHVERNALLLKESPVHNTNDQYANLHAQLLNICREKRLNKYQNRADEMRDNIRQLFETNSQLQALMNQSRSNDVVQRPTPDLFINTKEFHDKSYAAFLEDMEKRRKRSTGDKP